MAPAAWSMKSTPAVRSRWRSLLLALSMGDGTGLQSGLADVAFDQLVTRFRLRSPSISYAGDGIHAMPAQGNRDPLLAASGRNSDGQLPTRSGHSRSPKRNPPTRGLEFNGLLGSRLVRIAFSGSPTRNCLRY